MSSGTGSPELVSSEPEKLAVARAKEKVSAVRWDISVAVYAFASLVAVVILRLEGVAIEIVAIIAIAGLSMFWFMGWRRGKQLFRHFYAEELLHLQQVSGVKKAEATIPSVLTRRETEILDYIARGYMNKQVAIQLGLSEQTIKNHLSSILRKLDVNDRTRAVVLAMQNGWISSQYVEPSESATSDRI